MRVGFACSLALAIAGLAERSACAHSLCVDLLPDEGWWGGVTTLGTKAPYGLKAKSLSFDIRRFNYENQVVPLMLPTRGRCGFPRARISEGQPPTIQ